MLGRFEKKVKIYEIICENNEWKIFSDLINLDASKNAGSEKEMETHARWFDNDLRRMNVDRWRSLTVTKTVLHGGRMSTREESHWAVVQLVT